MSIDRIEGPVFPIVTPFVRDTRGRYPIDVPALRRYVDFLLDKGAGVLMVASATSRFAQLEESEIRLVNEVVVEQVGDRGIAIASTGILGPTFVHLETAQRAESIGAPVIACEYPWRYQSTEALVSYFQTICENTDTIKVMLHVTPGRSELGGQYRYNVDDLRVILSLPRVIAMKEAAGDPEVSKSIWEKLSGQTSIIVASKGMQSFFDAHGYGVSGFFVGTGSLVPRYSIDFFNHVRAGELEQARAIIDHHELPFLKTAKGFGWHAALKAGLAEMGIMNDVERPPMISIRPGQRATLGRVIREAGWLD